MTNNENNPHPHPTNYDPDAIETNFRFIEQLPSFWSTQFRDQVIERQPVDPETLRLLQQQTVKYATYRSHGSAGYGVEASASQLGWCKQISAAHNGQRLYNVNVLPNNIKLEITQAPTEFACPVKQDKRMLPDFKVRATMMYDKDQEGLYCPLTLKTEVISFEQYAQMCSWSPSTTKERNDMINDSRKFQVPLKGTREIFHLFATDNMRQGHRPPPAPFHFPPSLSYLNSGMNHPHYDVGSSHHHNSTGLDDLDIDFNMMAQSRQRSTYNNNNSNNQYHMHALYPKQEAYTDMYGTDMYNPYPNTFQSSSRASSARYGTGYGTGRGTSITDNLYEQLATTQGGFQMQQRGDRANGQNNSELIEISHEFVFTNLEFKKPTRMQKVYLVFYATIENVDLLYILFKMPTVCICRAEQRFRACTLLGIPSYRKPKNYPSPLKLKGVMQGWDEKISTIRSGQNVQLTQGQLWEMSVGLDHDRPPNSQSSQPPHQALQNPTQGMENVIFATYSHETELESDNHVVQVADSMDGVSGSTIWEYVCEEYQKTGLQRELSSQDKQGIWKMASCIDEKCYISQEQFSRFQQDFQKVLQVLMKFAKYWNVDNDVHYMTHWGLSSTEAAKKLVDESPGSCILRLSQTSMGSISLTVALQQGFREQSVKEIRHFLIKYDQLMSLPSGSLDLFFQKFGVEFIVDPITKRKTPRENLISNYTNWEEALETLKAAEENSRSG